MIQTGLTSITFRQLSVEQIIELAVETGLEGIEWGGDVHVPAGDEALARLVGEKTRLAGLAACSYGSYYRGDRESGDFAPVLASARALETPLIRVWAGRTGAADASADYRAEVIQCLRSIADGAAAEGIAIGLEYHAKTLTDTQESAHRLLKEVDRPNLRLYWQPRNHGAFENDMAELEAALPCLAHVHVFHWITGENGGIDRRPLHEGESEWRAFFQRVEEAAGDRFAILEFVRDDDPDQFRYDAATLKSILGKA